MRIYLYQMTYIIYYKGKYHVFYQHNPAGPYWSQIRWGHLVSEDMIHWKAVKDAVVPTAGVCPIYHMDPVAGTGFIPTEYVDISDTIELKLEALACHKSQIDWMRDHDHIDFLDFVRTCSKVRGYQSGVAYAEGFRPNLNYLRMTTKRLLP